MISGLMIIKDGLSLGYPFVEAITQVIPYVDEFVVVDFGSSDGTIDILKSLILKYPKIKVMFADWPTEFRGGRAIGVAQDQARVYCKGDYILLVQADEIWDPQALKHTIELTKLYPLVAMFNIPFYHLFANFQLPVKWYGEAVRVYKNIPQITSVGDGWTMTGHYPQMSARCTPILHCGSLGWRSSYQKIVHHAGLYTNHPEYQVLALEYQARLDHNDPEPNHLLKTSPYLSRVPKILHDLLGIERYYVRPKLI